MPIAFATVWNRSSTVRPRKVCMSEHDPSVWLASIAELFDELGLEWTVIGALAANRYRATPRFTTDVDTLAEYDPSLLTGLQRHGYEVEVIADQGEAPHLLRCRRGPESVDILLPVVEYQRHALARPRHHRRGRHHPQADRVASTRSRRHPLDPRSWRAARRALHRSVGRRVGTARSVVHDRRLIRSGLGRETAAATDRAGSATPPRRRPDR
jgi:hypothetical protein